MREPAEVKVFSSWLGKAITRLAGKPGSLRFRLARDTVGVMTIQGLSMGLGFAVSAVLARFLGVREFGLYSLAMSVLALLVVPVTFGFPELLVREIAAYRVKGEWGLVRGLLRFTLRTSLFASLGIAFLGLLILWLLSDRFSGETVQVLALAFVALPFWSLLQLHGASLRGFEQILAGQWVVSVMRPLGFLILVGAAWIFTRGVADAYVALEFQILAAGVSLAFSYYLLRGQIRRSVPSSTVSQNAALWVRSSLSLTSLYLIGLIPQHAGILMLGWMRSPEEVGWYKVAYQTSLLIPLGFSIVKTVAAPSVSRLFTEGNQRVLQQLIFKVTIVSLLLALPFTFLLLTQNSWLLITMFGSEFRQGREPLIMLTFSQIVYVLTGPLGLYFVMTRHESQLALASGIAWFTHIILNLFLIPRYGINGAAISHALSMVMFYVIVLYLYRRLSSLGSGSITINDSKRG